MPGTDQAEITQSGEDVRGESGPRLQRRERGPVEVDPESVTEQPDPEITRVHTGFVQPRPHRELGSLDEAQPADGDRYADGDA